VPVLDKEAFFKKIGHVPHSRGQWEYHRSNARFRVPVCGRRYGKSTMAGRDLEPKCFEENRRYWIVGPTYDLGEKEFRVIWTDLIVNQKLGRHKRVRKAYNKNQGQMFIEFPWQTRVEVRSAQHPESLVGDNLDHVIMSEAAKHKEETFIRFIRPALADRRGGADFPTTPEGQNWLYTYWQHGQDEDMPDYESWRFPSWENPIVYPGGREDREILDIEGTTSYEWFMQEIGADFTSFVGKIFGEFDETVHVRHHTFNPAWTNYIAFDWGFVNPLAAIEFQVDPFDNVYVWREHYKSYWRLEQHLEFLKNREQPDGYHLDGAFGDAADPEAASYVSAHLVPCMAEPEAKDNWRQGIEVVKRFLKTYQVGVADEYGTPLEEPKFYLDSSCKETRKEFLNYRAKENFDSQTPEATKNSVAVKENDHGLDALRYALVSLFELGAKHHLREVQGSGVLVIPRGQVLTDPHDSKDVGMNGGLSIANDLGLWVPQAENMSIFGDLSEKVF
jgi:hypothetical protein